MSRSANYSWRNTTLGPSRFNNAIAAQMQNSHFSDPHQPAHLVQETMPKIRKLFRGPAVDHISLKPGLFETIDKDPCASTDRIVQIMRRETRIFFWPFLFWISVGTLVLQIIKHVLREEARRRVVVVKKVRVRGWAVFQRKRTVERGLAMKLLPMLDGVSEATYQDAK